MAYRILGDLIIPASNINGFEISGQAQGDILYFNGTAWVRLPAETDGYVLTTHDSGENPTWEGAASGFTAGGDLSGTSTSQTVNSVHGASVPIAGSLTTGNILQVTGSSSLSYATLNLAGGSNFVTGLLPFNNLATITAVNSVTMPVGGSLTTGTILRATGAGSASYGALDLSNTNAIIGTLPDGYQAAQTVGGDLSGTTSSATVIKLQNRAVASTAPTDGYVLTWVNANSDWEPKPAASGFTAGGDLSGNSTSQNVIALHSATTSVNVGSATAPSSGQVLTATSSTTATWQTASGGSSPPPIDGYTVALWQQTETASTTTWNNLATTGSIGTAALTASGVSPGNSTQFLPGARGAFGYNSYTSLSTTIGPSLTITYGIRGTGPSPSTSNTDWTIDCFYKPTHTAQATSSNAVIFGRRATTTATPTATSDWAFLLYQGSAHATGYQGWGYVVTFADGNTFRWSTAGGGSETLTAGGGAVAGTWALASNIWHHIGFKLLINGGNISYLTLYNGMVIAGGNAHTGSSTPKWLSASPEWVCLAGYNSATYGAPHGMVTNCQLSNTARPTSYFVDATARIT